MAPPPETEMLTTGCLATCLRRELVQVLSCKDDSFSHEVLASLVACSDELCLRLPSAALGGPEGQEAVSVTIKGRTACELLVECAAGAALPRRVVAVHYTAALNSMDLDQLLAVVDRMEASGQVDRLLPALLCRSVK